MKISDDKAKETLRTLTGQEFGCQNKESMGGEVEGAEIKAPSQEISEVSSIPASGNFPLPPCEDALAAQSPFTCICHQVQASRFETELDPPSEGQLECVYERCKFY